MPGIVRIAVYEVAGRKEQHPGPHSVAHDRRGTAELIIVGIVGRQSLGRLDQFLVDPVDDRVERRLTISSSSLLAPASTSPGENGIGP